MPSGAPEEATKEMDPGGMPEKTIKISSTFLGAPQSSLPLKQYTQRTDRAHRIGEANRLVALVWQGKNLRAHFAQDTLHRRAHGSGDAPAPGLSESMNKFGKCSLLTGSNRISGLLSQ